MNADLMHRRPYFINYLRLNCGASVKPQQPSFIRGSVGKVPCDGARIGAAFAGTRSRIEGGAWDEGGGARFHH